MNDSAERPRRDVVRTRPGRGLPRPVLGLVAILTALLLPTASPALLAEGEAVFGDLHAHSALSDDASNPPDAFFRVARDVAGLDFVVLSDHDAFLTDDEWEILKTTAASFDLPGRFVAFPAIEWTHRWHMNVYFRDDDESWCSSRDCPEAADFYAFYGPRVQAGEAAAHVNHPADLFKVNWDEIDDEVTNAVEVWNTAGAGDNELGFGNALFALRAGFRLGLVGVSDDHHSERSPPLLGTGLTGCHVGMLAREEILAALKSRRCWATSGERMSVDFSIGETRMGGESSAPLGSRVGVAAFVEGTRAPVEVELVRNGDVVARRRCATARCPIEEDVRIDEPHTFVYLRAEQAGGARAWSSPVWIQGTCPGDRPCLEPRLASGGGTAEDDCLTEFLLPATPASDAYARARGRVRCTDGDRSCDFGDREGECVLRIGLCFGVRDRRLGGCAPAVPESFEVLHPAASTDRETPAFQNRATLLAAFRAASGGEGLERCSALSEIRVPVGGERLEIASGTGSRHDADVLELECRPRRGERRLPLIEREHVHADAAASPTRHGGSE